MHMHDNYLSTAKIGISKKTKAFLTSSIPGKTVHLLEEVRSRSNYCLPDLKLDYFSIDFDHFDFKVDSCTRGLPNKHANFFFFFLTDMRAKRRTLTARYMYSILWLWPTRVRVQTPAGLLVVQVQTLQPYLWLQRSLGQKSRPRSAEGCTSFPHHCRQLSALCAKSRTAFLSFLFTFAEHAPIVYRRER